MEVFNEFAIHKKFELTGTAQAASFFEDEQQGI